MDLHRDETESCRVARRAVDFACELVAAHWDRPVRARCTDVSPYGMWLETSLPVSAGDTVVISFTPPKRQREMMLFGTVCRSERSSDGSGVGVEFASMEWFEQKTLADCLRGMPPRFPG
jgi:PilZ domain